MIEQWIAGVVGEMHINKITQKALASEIGWNDKYLCQVLNGHETPKGAEEKIRAALERLKGK